MMNSFEDDGWGDLAAELGVDAPKAVKPVKVEAPPPLPEPVKEAPAAEPAPEDLSNSLFADLPPEVVADVMPAKVAEPMAEADEAETGPDAEVIELGGTDEQKKRRRRRRRGKKKDGEETPDTAEAEAPEPEAEGFTQPSELLKDIIAHWDVPSWDEIVGGLYRPNR